MWVILLQFAGLTLVGYDADEGTIVHIMDTENFKLDAGHIWIPIQKAQEMLSMENEVTYVAYEKGLDIVQDSEDWIHRDVSYLIKDIEAAIEADKPANQIMFIILLTLAGMGISMPRSCQFSGAEKR